MKKYFSLLVMCFVWSLTFGQKLNLRKASPFTAVKWEKEKPIVQFQKMWYKVEKIEHLEIKEILDFCKKQYAHKWQKRFSEDLVEVLHEIGYKPDVKINLLLSSNGVKKKYLGIFTLENREKVRKNNIKNSEAKIKRIPQNVSRIKAIEDIEEFVELVNKKSSYAKISKYDYKASAQELIGVINENFDSVNINFLTNELGKVMCEIGDRHASIRNLSFNKKEHISYQMQLPFGVVPVEDKLLALKPDGKSYYDKEFPYIASINGIEVKAMIDKLNYEDKKAPKAAKVNRGASSIQRLGALLFNNNINFSKTATITFRNKNNENKTRTVSLIKENAYTKTLNQKVRNDYRNLLEEKYENLDTLIGKNIGYITIPAMNHYKNNGLEAYFHAAINRYHNAKALIIDIRNNPGGGREILQTFASYLVMPAQSPWVANLAYLRTDHLTDKEKKSMNGRYLYKYHSEKFKEADRKAIDVFNISFQTERTFDITKFSEPYYMVLKSGNQKYDKPVFILVNESSFSAASVFTSVFKGLPNIKIAGVTTDGSSGNAKIYYLSNSGIRVKVSTMLSFQRNGKTLDGNGTEPDIYIPITESDYLTRRDIQLEKLIQLIDEK